MTKDETQTRQKIIDSRLKQSGWNVDDPSQVTQELDIWVGLPEGISEPQTPYQGHLFADYALLGRDGSPIAVVEAKRTSVDAEIGKEQARNYAEKIHQKNGRPMPFVFYTNGYEIFYWDTEKYPPRKVLGFPTLSDLERLLYLRKNAKPLSSDLINTDIAGRPYQIQAIRSVLEKIEKGHRKSLLVMATGTGKTRTCIGLIDILMRTNWAQRILFLVDRVALRQQAIEAFQEHLPNAPIWPKQGEVAFESDRRVYVATYPTMLNLIQQDQCPLNPQYFDMIIADESHRSIYNVYNNIFEYFDAIQLGLTATPKNHIDHNTFGMFNCDEGFPTFAYSFTEAVNNKPPYLCDFDSYRIKTKFQQEGINSASISESDQIKLIREGEDVDSFDFEGTELEKKVTNKGTNAVIIREFMEESFKDPDGVLPGKTIIFAISKKHAYRLEETLNSLYPEYKGQLAEVILSDVKGVHGKGGLLDRFKTQNMPRIAISVDMLDTGIDILEVVNLVFAKPVFSYTKFWQMIGRGTRILDEDKIKPWCIEKNRFLVLDCWENFEYFKMKPKGKEPSPSNPLPVRLFRSRLEKLATLIELKDHILIDKSIDSIKKDIDSIPKNSVGVLDNMEHMDRVNDDRFWKDGFKIDIEYLSRFLAPLMRYRSNEDYKAMSFELDIVDLSTARLRNENDQFEALKEGIIEKVAQLPLTVNIVGKQKELIEKAQKQHFWIKANDDEFDEIFIKLAPLMKYRDQGGRRIQKKIDLQDLLVVKEKIKFGPEHESMPIQQYRMKVEKFIRELVKTNPVLQKIINGDEVSDEEIDQLADILESHYPHITEYILREVYDNRRAQFIEFIKHILGLEPLATFTETVSMNFDEFIRQHNDYSQKQIQFLLSLKTFVLERGKVEKKDLIHAPFTQIHPEGIRGVFKQSEIDEILTLAKQFSEDKG